MKLSVIIPVYNEEKTVADIIARVRACGVPDLELVVVNDCSTDNTRAILEAMPPAPDLIIVHHEKNQGKGAAIRTGQQHVHGDVAVVQDADLEYDPEEFPKMLRPIEQGLADVVYGSRYCGESRMVDTFWHFAVNRFITNFFNFFANIHLSDVETCYKMAKTVYFKQVNLTCDRFGFDPELSAKLVRLKCRFYEVPINYHPRSFEDGKKIGAKDGFVILWTILKFTVFRCK